MEVYADGGVRRGSHVITLLALGARAVGLGRSPVFANIWGEAGVSRLIDMMRTEIETTMALMGQANTATLDATSVSGCLTLYNSSVLNYTRYRSTLRWLRLCTLAFRFARFWFRIVLDFDFVLYT